MLKSKYLQLWEFRCWEGRAERRWLASNPGHFTVRSRARVIHIHIHNCLDEHQHSVILLTQLSGLTSKLSLASSHNDHNYFAGVRTEGGSYLSARRFWRHECTSAGTCSRSPHPAAAGGDGWRGSRGETPPSPGSSRLYPSSHPRRPPVGLMTSPGVSGRTAPTGRLLREVSLVYTGKFHRWHDTPPPATFPSLSDSYPDHASLGQG